MNADTLNDSVTMSGGVTTLAGRYRVIRQLGQGGMGSVWLAEDEKLDNRPVAIKMLPAILVTNKRAYQQVKSEALVSLKLSHANIVTVRSFEEEKGNPFLVMDYIEGRTLDDYLAEKGKFSEEETIRLLTPIAAALDYAHSKGVVHRDIKPTNVMVASDGTPYVLDFGIAREIQETMTRMTGRMSSGTLMYMSPEQLQGAKPSAAQDIYSFAAMVYECLKGEPPFCRGSIEDQIKNVDAQPLPGHIGIGSRIMRGLAKRTEFRVATCVEVLMAPVDHLGEEEKSPHDGVENPQHAEDSGLPTDIHLIQARIRIYRREIDAAVSEVSDYCGGHPGHDEFLEAAHKIASGFVGTDIPSAEPGAIACLRAAEEAAKSIYSIVGVAKLKDRIESSILPALDAAKAETYNPDAYRKLNNLALEGVRCCGEGRYAEALASFTVVSDEFDEAIGIANEKHLSSLRAVAQEYRNAGMMSEFVETVQAALNIAPGEAEFRRSLQQAWINDFVLGASIDGRQVARAEILSGDEWVKLPIPLGEIKTSQTFNSDESCIKCEVRCGGKYFGVFDWDKVDFTRPGSQVLIPLHKFPGSALTIAIMWKLSRRGCVYAVFMTLATALMIAVLSFVIMCCVFAIMTGHPATPGIMVIVAAIFSVAMLPSLLKKYFVGDGRYEYVVKLSESDTYEYQPIAGEDMSCNQ